MVLPAGRYRVTAYRCDEWDEHDRGRRLGTQVVNIVEGKSSECRF
ncbi:MAG TPA: hypothetical protein VEI02_01835 [Planctomycetota bacterium]|nr:hypothetical protein [Planctomycetota bacterium]